MSHTLILLIVVGGYSVSNPLERQYEFADLEACQAAIAAMKVEMTQQTNQPDPLAAFCVPTASVGKSAELVACEQKLQTQNEAAAQCNVQLSECLATKGQFAGNPTECWQADFNGDGLIGSVDGSILTQYQANFTNWFGQTCP